MDEPEIGEQELGPCRLAVILARDAPRAVVFRRGPSQWVRCLMWETDSDTVTPGQWFRVRIYEHRCDLSPDGSLLIYFASKFNRHTLADREYTYAWTAVSRPPWLTALALWPKGDCWHGGGHFLDATTVWLNHRPAAATPHPDHAPGDLQVVPNPEARGEDEPILYRRLERDGWRITDVGEYSGWTADGVPVVRPQVWEKTHPDGRHHLVMRYLGYLTKRYGPNRVFTYAVKPERGAEEALNQVTWADWDQHGRLVVARAGQLLASPVPTLRGHVRLVADLNRQQPEPLVAPAWAQRW